MARRWIQGALRRHHRGALHRMLGVPAGEKIPAALLEEAVAHPERFAETHAARLRLVRRANLALTLRRIGRRRKRR